MRLQRLVLIAACCVAGQIGPTWASALTVLQPTRFDEVLDDVYRGSPAEPESIEIVIDDGQGHAIEHAATTGGALPTAEVTITANSFESAHASARVEFQFAVEQIIAGPLVLVPILVTGAGDAAVSVEGTDGAIAFSRIAVTGAGETRTTACAPPENWGGAELCVGDPFAVMLHVPTLPGGVLTVTIEAFASGGPGPSGGSLAASAWVDPIVAIDPAFARRDEFRLVFSEGVNPVPEPSMGAGALAAIAAIAPLARTARARRRCAT